MRLTDQTVRSLPHPQNGQRDYADDTVKGFTVRVGKHSKTFIVTTGRRESRNGDVVHPQMVRVRIALLILGIGDDHLRPG